MTEELVSIIIVNFNGKTYLEKCLESLTKIDYKNVEIIFVDNNSIDDSVEFVKNNYPKMMIIKLDKNYGFAEANNIGVKNSKGELLLFLNNDTIVTPNFVTSLVSNIKKDEKIGVCQSLLLKNNGEVDSSGDFIDKIGVAFNSTDKVDKIKEIFSARGASMLIRKSVFEKLHGFDDKFFTSFEDVDLGWRTWLIGFRVVVIPDSIVWHLGGQTTKTMKKEMAFHGLKNQLSMKITNFEFTRSLSSLFLFFVLYGIRVFRIKLDYKTKGKTQITSTQYEKKIAEYPRFRIALKSVFWILKNFKYLQQKRKMVNSTRVLSTKDLEDRKLIIDSF